MWHFAGLAFEADWVEAWATVAAAIGTIGAFAWQARLLKQEQKTRRDEVARLDADRRDAQAAQARTVVLHDGYARPARSRGTISGYSAKLGNYGEQPVTNVVGSLLHLPTKTVIPESRYGPERLAILQGNFDLHWTIDEGVQLPWPDGYEAGSEEMNRLFQCEVQFTDVHGVRWAVRHGLGQQPLRVFDANSGSPVKPQGLGHRAREAARVLRGF